MGGCKSGWFCCAWAAVAITIAGCEQTRSDGRASTGGFITTSADPGSSSGPDDPDGSDQEEKLDVAGSGPGASDGCRYVDILFVIDNSGSMCDAQEGLAGALPGLVDAMFDALPAGVDLHVGIVTTSFSDGGSHQERDCQAQEGAASIAEHYVTDAMVPGNGYQGRLFEFDGMRYFEANTGEPDTRAPLQTWFTDAVTAVGCDGGAYEYPAAAAAYAMHPSTAEHNAGFLRDAGAALALFVLTNEVDQSLESMEFYRDTILEAKSACGGVDCITTAGLLAPDCVPSANPVIWQFLNAFGSEPTWGDIENFGGYEAVVSGALAEAIAATCEEIEPIG